MGALEETAPIREKAELTKATAEDVHSKAQDAHDIIHAYHERILTLISDIDDLLQKKSHTDPVNILEIAGDVLKLELPDSDLINKLKQQMAALGMNNEGQSDGDPKNIIEVTELEKEATNVLSNAKQLSSNVIQALENLKTSEHNCANAQSMTNQANEDNQKANAMNAEIVNSLKTLQGLMNILSELHTKDNGIHSVIEDINRKISATNQNFDVATTKTESAKSVADPVQDDFEEYKKEDDYKIAIGFVETTNDLRHIQNRAAILKDSVAALLDAVKDYDETWNSVSSTQKKIQANIEVEIKELKEMKTKAAVLQGDFHNNLFTPCE